MTQKQHIAYWLESAAHDLETADTLYDAAHYDWCLFIGHLVVEKILKAHYVKELNKVPPKSHDLVKLSEALKLDIDENTIKFMLLVNTFNLETRYPDERRSFYKVCNSDFAEINFNKIKELYKWLKSLI